MELTKREIEIADRCISKRERQLAQWPLKRWLILAIFSVSALVGYRTSSDGMRSIHDDTAADFQVRHSFGDAPPPGEEHRWAVGSMIKVYKVLELRQQVVADAMMEVALGYVLTISAAITVCLTLLRWNMRERDALICKLLRAKLQELAQNAAPGSRPPPLPPAAVEVQPSEIKTL